MIVHQILRVTSIRSQNPRGFGGCIFTAKPIDDIGNIQDAAAYYVVRASGPVLGATLVQTGQWWNVSGDTLQRNIEVNGFKLAEWQIEATSAFLMRPSGEHIVSFMADNPAFVGIGQVKARKLWETLGNRLYAALDGADVDTLSKVLSPESAVQVVGAWAQFGDSQTLQWLQAEGFELALGRKVMKFFGNDTAEKIKIDPYRLLSFCATWRQVDKLALEHFDVPIDDPRRLQGAIEEACYRIFAVGHTTALSAMLMDYLQAVLGSQTKTFKWRNLVSLALSQGLTNGSFVISLHGVQPLGALVMEQQVAKAVVNRLTEKCNQPLLNSDDVNQILADYEHSEGIDLNLEQRSAIHLAIENSLALITGGAGVGKTTVLKALYQVYDRANVEIVQVALAGRAARRMQEATGRPATTIASLIRAWKGNNTKLSVVVVDEASMVDIISMHRLCELLEPKVRLVLVGDPAQLMPVGPGLVLHALIKIPEVPLAELKVIKRYGSVIAAAATSIRNGRWPELSELERAAIAFVECDGNATGPNSIPETVLRLYSDDPENTQILCARRSGFDGVKLINCLCQESRTTKNTPLTVWSNQHDVQVLTGFRLNDPILCTRNLWEMGIQNGSLGIIVEIENPPRLLISSDDKEIGYAIAWVEWDDGIKRPIFEVMLDDLVLGYAITIHKAQGSQWPRIIVPVTGHRLLDRTLVYTAVTRAQRQVLLVGNEAAVKDAVERQPRVNERQVSLDLLVKNSLREVEYHDQAIEFR